MVKYMLVGTPEVDFKQNRGEQYLDKIWLRIFQNL